MKGKIEKLTGYYLGEIKGYRICYYPVDKDKCYNITDFQECIDVKEKDIDEFMGDIDKGWSKRRNNEKSIN